MAWYTLPLRVGYPTTCDDEERSDGDIRSLGDGGIDQSYECNIGHRGDSDIQPAGDIGQAEGNVRSQGDGYIGSLLLFVIMSSIGLSMCLSHWFSMDSGELDIYFGSTGVYSILSTYMTSAILVMMLIWHGWRTYYTLEPSHLFDADLGLDLNGYNAMSSRLRRVTHWAWQIIGKTPDRVVISMFSAFSIVLGVIIIIPTERCLTVYQQCNLQVKYAMTLTYHVVRILFIVFLLMFCLKFRNYKMKRVMKIRYGLVVIASTTIVISFVSALHSSYNMPFDENESKDIVCFDHKNNISWILSENELGCLYEIGPQHNVTRRISHYLYPIHMQFLVMASKTIPCRTLDKSKIY